jgi:hypothetical protein
MSQFLAKVEAIRKALGLRPAEELPAPLAISDAMALMGIKANESWALPERFEALKEALDLTGFGKSRAASSAKACSNHARAYIGAISKGLGQAEDLRCCRATVCIKAAQALRCDGRPKLQFNRRELDQAAAAQRAGEAIAYNELESKYSQPVVKFRSEITHKSVARVRHRVAAHKSATFA